MRAVLVLILAVATQGAFAQAGSWATLPASPQAPARDHLDDIFFVSEDLGWLVDTGGKIWKTADGGASWTLQLTDALDLGTRVIFRSVGFANENLGFAGNLGNTSANPDYRNLLYETRDGGETWTDVTDRISGDRPSGICGIWVVDEEVAYAVGRYGLGRTGVLKTADGGLTWTGKSMQGLAGVLIDVYFFDRDTGIMIGSTAPEDGVLDSWSDLDTVRGAVFMTDDGGDTWEMKHAVELTQSWGWKISFPTRQTGYVAIQGRERIVLKTTDGGETWTETVIPGETGLWAVGFITEEIGWVAGRESFVTRDGGATWSPASVGTFLNRIRVIDVDLAYATGERVYKYTGAGVADESPADLPQSYALHPNYPNPFNPATQITFDLPEASYVRLEIFEVTGRSAGILVNGMLPAGFHARSWNAAALPSGVYILRMDAGTYTAVRALVLAK